MKMVGTSEMCAGRFLFDPSENAGFQIQSTVQHPAVI